MSARYSLAFLWIIGQAMGVVKNGDGKEGTEGNRGENEASGNNPGLESYGTKRFVLDGG